MKNKPYKVAFAPCLTSALDRYKVSKNCFQTLKEARAYANQFYNAYILTEDADGRVYAVQTLAELRASRKRGAKK